MKHSSSTIGLIDVHATRLANNGIRVIIAGLDMDFKKEIRSVMPQLCAIADEVSKVHAICVKCGQWPFSHRTVRMKTGSFRRNSRI